MTRTMLLACSLSFLFAFAGCGGPGRTETTTTASHETTAEGQEIQHSSTETTEVHGDGSQTVDHTETTQTQSPPPSSH